MDLGNELRPTARMRIEIFSFSLRQYLFPLRHIRIHTVLLVDHLGRNLPIPELFCSSWKVCSVSSVRSGCNFANPEISGFRLHYRWLLQQLRGTSLHQEG